ncbi:hypothetical protein D1007_46611 [Hordeum vulgare]|uniref:Predicted protein n=1 Tax=Hordeum vulgare subsp. vulgare TaxID=112509 RepID=F2E4D7_HORVV|nr:uncharacterized protein LOC123409891 [Hordeum vulgare subsp. vulgare]KAE8780219.1 hypothetical protein D1007_46611 [Hordeum vulgare]KAI5016643.1 hypothetical protein ZWY2020_006494 [Hordeum vulgare]BAK02209.1 predicted protein [Hordeum vulgare subsp. vulgare]
MNCSLLKAAAVAVVVAVLAATAGANSFVSAPPLPSVLSSPPCVLWIAANVIVVWLWLVPSYRHRGAAVAAVLSSTASDVSALMGGMLFPSSEPDVFAAAPDAVVAPPAPVWTSRPRDARTAKIRPVDRARVRKKPAGEGKAGGAAAEAKKERSQEEKPRPSAAATEAVGVDDMSMDSAWQSIVRSGAARPVAVRKSETWGGEELPRMRRAADKAVVARREMRKSATMVPPSPPHPASASSPVAARQGWRTRDVLGMAQDELLRRAESFIRRQHEHLRIQRQESEQRQAVEHDRRRPAPIRV